MQQHLQSEANFVYNASLLSGYHTYAVLWTPGSMTYYVDGVAIWTGSGAPVSQRSEYMILSSEVNSGSWAGNTPAGGYGSLATSTTTMLVDYVRVSSAGSYNLRSSNDFSTASTTGWRGVGVSGGAGAATLTGGVTDTAFNAGTQGSAAASQKVMTVVGNAAAPTRAQLDFAPVTLTQVGDSIIVALDFRLATDVGTGVDRRFYLSLFDASNPSAGAGYPCLFVVGKDVLGFVLHAPGQKRGDRRHRRAGIGMTLSEVSQYLGSSLTDVRSLQLTVTKTATGATLTFLFEDSTGVLRTISVAHASSYSTFSALSLNTWGVNGVNFNVDDVTVTYVAAVPEPAAYASCGALVLRPPRSCAADAVRFVRIDRRSGRSTSEWRAHPASR
ncbi:MAG: glycoside hydrolase family 16 protein [Pseudomonas sp.]